MSLRKSIRAEDIAIDLSALSEYERTLVPYFVRSAIDGLVSGASYVAWESGKTEISDSTRETYLTAGCKMARMAGIDMSDIAYRLAEHRQNQKEKKASANPKPAKIDILDKVDHWPEPYRSTFRRMVWANKADDDALAEYYLRTGTVPLKHVEENRLKSIRFAVDRMFKWLASKRLPVRIDDNTVAFWLASMRTSKSGHASIASYIGRIKALAAIALPGQSLVYLEKTQEKYAKLAKREVKSPFGTDKPAKLFDIADALNAEAEAALKDPAITSQQAALLYRDSIAHGLFAEIPLRGHNAVAMKFGHNYVENDDGTATVTFYPDETKEDNIIGPYSITKELARRVRRWLDVFRPMVSPYAGDWIFPARCSEKGLSLCQLAKIVKRKTKKSIHKIRHDATTELYTELPDHRDYGRVRLGQKRQSSTDIYAPHANGRIAGRQYKEIRKHEISRISKLSA